MPGLSRRGCSAVLTDAGISGETVKDRPALVEALRMLDNGEADVLLVTEFDRLSRSLLDFAALLERSGRSRAGGRPGWAIRVLDPDIDLTTISGRAMAGVLMVFAQFERETIGQRVKSGMPETSRGRGVRFRAGLARPCPQDRRRARRR
jgi:DNA invertase Pin-like site-specific DNA recombinase